MLAPIFTHGTYENTIKAIESGKIKYPSYCWITDKGQYGFLNKNNELEVVGIPELTGTLDNKIILSSLNDGLYQVKGQHKITADHATTFDCSSYIIVIIQTINETKKIRRITADELTTYIVGEDLSVKSNEVATKEYLDDKGYSTEEELDEKIAVLKAELESEIEDLVEPVVLPLVQGIIEEEIQPEDDEKIRELFR